MLQSLGTDPSAHFSFAPASGKRRTVNRGSSSEASNGRRELAALLERVATGDANAFASVYQRTSAKLYGICLRLLSSEAEAQDVLQDVYMTVWRKAEQFDVSKASPITWLATLARNRSIDRLRRPTISTEEIEAAADVRDERPSADEVVEEADDAARLYHCLDELEENSRAMIRAAFLDGETYPQLAEREGVPLGTMKSWIRRGLLRLRGCLER